MLRQIIEGQESQFLLDLAKERGIRVTEKMERRRLIEAVIEAIEEDWQEQEQSNNFNMRIKSQKFGNLWETEIKTPLARNFPLAESYDENKIVLLLRDPHWAFAYWDIRKRLALNLALNSGRSKIWLRIFQSRDDAGKIGKTLDFVDISLNERDRSWYINLPKTGVFYSLNLMFSHRGGHKTLACSNAVKNPRIDSSLSANAAGRLAEDLKGQEGLKGESEIPQRIISFYDSHFLT